MKLSIICLISLLVASVSAGNLFHKLAKHLVQPTNELHAIPGDSPLKYCDSDHSDDVLTIEKLDLIPNPPIRGKPLTIRVVGVIKDVVTQGASVDLTVKYGLIPLIKESINICENVDELNLVCPIHQGEVILTRVVDIPKLAPRGKYTVKYNAGFLAIEYPPLLLVAADY
ncbi:hypothetical protein HOY80DRAFT_1022032 [Tuber brumale]|nr:hypothetical protein HOY80DRAFT_1022032 [Tuber brumale]